MTAEQAREISRLNTNTGLELQEAFKEIEKAAKEGKFEIKKYDIHTETIRSLQEVGYVVLSYGNNGYIISW
jgi:hypothetical protein